MSFYMQYQQEKTETQIYAFMFTVKALSVIIPIVSIWSLLVERSDYEIINWAMGFDKWQRVLISICCLVSLGCFIKSKQIEDSITKSLTDEEIKNAINEADKYKKYGHYALSPIYVAVVIMILLVMFHA